MCGMIMQPPLDASAEGNAGRRLPEGQSTRGAAPAWYHAQLRGRRLPRVGTARCCPVRSLSVD